MFDSITKPSWYLDKPYREEERKYHSDTSKTYHGDIECSKCRKLFPCSRMQLVQASDDFDTVLGVAFGGLPKQVVFNGEWSVV